MEHTEPEGVTVGHRVADAHVEPEGDTVGERLWVTLLLYVGDTEGERDWLGDDVQLPLSVVVSEKERVVAPLRETVPETDQERVATPLVEGEADTEGQVEGDALGDGLREATSVAFAVRLRDTVTTPDCVTEPEDDTDAEELKEGRGVKDSSASSTFTVMGVAGANTGSPSLYTCTKHVPNNSVPVRKPVEKVPG